ncbi:MAG: cupin domain-containing protein [Anaerolineales bacterium]|nr:cupin domain-containing protein [Anaerolineales bacterium]MCZ2120659.1 cupin domain-containing protein [Anaerolineales bacterium]
MSKDTLNLSEKPHVLADLIATQSGAVVSRVLLNKPTGTITLFAFDEGEGLSEHTSPYNALVQILEGEAHIFINSVEHVVSAGSVIMLPANAPHMLQAQVAFKMLLTMIREKKEA